GAAHVAPGNEDVAGAGDEQAGQVGVTVHTVRRVANAEGHRRRHRVARLRPVDDAAGHWAVALEAQELRAQPVALGRTPRHQTCSITSAPKPAMVSTDAKSVNHA